MCVENHLKELQKKHYKLDQKLDQLKRSPANVSLEMNEVRKQKLRLKEEIERLQNPKRMTAGVLMTQNLADLEEDPNPKVDLPLVIEDEFDNQAAA